MCKMIFIGVSEQLAERPWNKDAPSFHISPLEPEEVPVRSKFSSPYVYQVGTSRGCSCDLFKYSEEVDEYDADREQFYNLINSYLSHGKQVEIYCCWAGDYNSPCEERTLIEMTEIGGDFDIKERELKVYRSS